MTANHRTMKTFAPTCPKNAIPVLCPAPGRPWRSLALSLFLLWGMAHPAFAGTYDATPGVPVAIWGYGFGHAAPGPTAQVQVTGNDFLAADGSGPTTLTLTGTTTNTNLPAVFSKFTSDVQISLEGSTVVLKSNGIPSTSAYSR